MSELDGGIFELEFGKSGGGPASLILTVNPSAQSISSSAIAGTVWQRAQGRESEAIPKENKSIRQEIPRLALQLARNRYWAGRTVMRSATPSTIQIMRTADSHYVEELTKVIVIRRTKSRRGTAVAYLLLECRNRPNRIPCLHLSAVARPRTQQP